MKNFKFILCFALLIVSGCFMFVGCNNTTTPPPTETTITVAEAKPIIVNALKIDEPRVSATKFLKSANEGNRNVLEKMKNVDFDLQSYKIDESNVDLTSENYVGTLLFNNGVVQKFISTHTNINYINNTTEQIKRYSPDGQKQYTLKNLEVIEGDYFQSAYTDAVFGIMYNSSFLYSFSDYGFDNLFVNNVTKKINSNGFDLLIEQNASALVRKYLEEYLNNIFSPDDVNDVCDMFSEASYKIKLSFDSLNNINASYYYIEDFKDGSTTIKANASFIKTNNQVEAPSWLNA